MQTQLQNVSEAFSRQSTSFDAYEEQNEILKWMRKQIRAHVMQFAKPGNQILELNAGTGLDAVYFAQQGLKVHATDNATGMLAELGKKVVALQLEDKITFEKCSFTELNKLKILNLPTTQKFDYVFSNFGGLNCIPDLKEVTKHLPELLNPGAYITFVLMPPVCPWEMLLALKGNFKTSFRRFKKDGDLAHLEGVYFKTYYFTPTTAIKAFSKDFKKVKLEGLASVSPPPYLEKFPVKFSAFYKKLTKFDSKLAVTFPFNSWCDHFILTMQYLP